MRVFLVQWGRGADIGEGGDTGLDFSANFCVHIISRIKIEMPFIYFIFHFFQIMLIYR